MKNEKKLYTRDLIKAIMDNVGVYAVIRAVVRGLLAQECFGANENLDMEIPYKGKTIVIGIKPCK